MWELVNLELPPDLSSITTSVWRYQDYGQVGVMRFSFLAPPVLWFQLGTPSRWAIRKSPELMTELQQLIYAPTVHAEVATENITGQRFLTYLGFTESPGNAARKMYLRSI